MVTGDITGSLPLHVLIFSCYGMVMFSKELCNSIKVYGTKGW